MHSPSPRTGLCSTRFARHATGFPPAWAILAAVTLASGCASREDPDAIPWRRWVEELGDPERICRLDVPGSGIVNSSDPTGENNDYNHYVRLGPEGWWVLADLQGPGCLTRLWMTGVEFHHRVRFYFDDERSPRMDLAVSNLFQNPPVFDLPLANFLEQGCFYSYVPIPYRKRLVVMTQAGATKKDAWPRVFYQINYRSLPAGTKLQELPRRFTPEDLAAVERCKTRWSDPAQTEPALTPTVTTLTVPAGATAALAALPGPAVIRALRMAPDLSAIPSATARERALRELVLLAQWDGAAAPSVAVPVGDLCGSMWRRTRFESFYFGMKGDALYTRLPMPFAREARLAFRNDGNRDIPLRVECSVERLTAWDAGRGYLHSAWNHTTPADVGKPHTVLRLDGTGRYAGCLLSVVSDDKSWWILEGDETIRLNGERRPSWWGTGLEDYFNGGWYYRNVRVGALQGLLRLSPFGTIQYRFHQPDAPAFTNGVEVQFERGPRNASRGWMESVGFAYLAQPQPVAQGAAPSSRPFPPDALEEHTLMTQVLDSERLGDFQGARDRIELFLESRPNHPDEPFLRLRQIACDERLNGIAAARPAYERFAVATTNAAARDQARALLWFHESPSNALLGAYCNAQTRVLLDGRPIGSADHPALLTVLPAQIPPGRHVLVVEARWTRPTPWVQVLLRTHGGEIGTSRAWKWTRSPAGDFSAGSYDDSRWNEVQAVSKGPPEEPHYRVEPNGFAGMQSGAAGLTALQWNKRKDTVVFRTVFEIP